MSNQIYWTKKHIHNLQQECEVAIIEDNPPPRAIIKGKINIKHFIYHLENLKIKIEIMKRKLNQRELQLKELRKRIVKLNEQLYNTKKQNKRYELINKQQVQEIKHLKNIISKIKLKK